MNSDNVVWKWWFTVLISQCAKCNIKHYHLRCPIFRFGSQIWPGLSYVAYFSKVELFAIHLCIYNIIIAVFLLKKGNKQKIDKSFLFMVIVFCFQPPSIVTDEVCTACDFNRPGKTCLRKLEWVWRGETFMATKRSFYIRMLVYVSLFSLPAACLSSSLPAFTLNLWVHEKQTNFLIVWLSLWTNTVTTITWRDKLNLSLLRQLTVSFQKLFLTYLRQNNNQDWRIV